MPHGLNVLFGEEDTNVEREANKRFWSITEIRCAGMRSRRQKLFCADSDKKLSFGIVFAVLE